MPIQARTPVSATDRKSTRLNSSHGYISYAVFCLKKNTPLSKRSRDSCRQARAPARQPPAPPSSGLPLAWPPGGPTFRPGLQVVYLFFFNDTATTEIYTLSLHDALPI